MKIFPTLICFFLITSTFAQKVYVLKQNYPIGKKYDYKLTSNQIIKQKIGDQNINLSQEIGTAYTFDVAANQGGDKTVKVIYDRINMKSTGMGNTLIMDSDQQEPGKPNPFAGLKGASFEMVFGPNGSIKKVNGVEKMLDNMASKMTSDTSQIRAIKASIGKQFSADGMKQTMESSFKVYPDKPVKIGDSWTVDTKMQMTMPVETITTYTLKLVKDGIAFLNVKGNLISKGGFDSMGTNIETDLKGTNSGDMQIDLQTGVILSSYLRLELYGTMKAKNQNIDFEMEGINQITGKAIN
ncbi:hypothetical protein DHW03_09135 [Pedobacter yonginense]|uniref:Uncharacterized protein n=1 Tax=Pedobacter yonginense TaxID=651869 RepID=A0A317EME4_9SPHI|nr:DUF6263 family protein [Pedobacter yonginense]PWS27732.1 hypothetical protein DHW03_09135 [Pedobacter yonginense]